VPRLPKLRKVVLFMKMNDLIRKFGPSVLVVGIIIFVTTLLHWLAFRYLDIEDVLDLKRGWQVCTTTHTINAKPSCENYKITLPDTKQELYKPLVKEGIEYRNQFISPTHCLKEPQNGCVFYLGGILEGVNVFINSEPIGSHYTRSNLYPASFYLPKTLLKSDGTENSISIQLYSDSPNVRAAIVQGPIGIMTLPTSQFITQGIVAERVVLPIVGAGICLSFALIALLWMLSTHSSPRISSDYALFCLASALYLLSLTRLPRDILDKNTGSALNFCLRYLMDLSTFNLVTTFFSHQSRSLKMFRYLYILIISMFAAIFISGLIAPNLFHSNLERLQLSITSLAGSRDDSFVFLLGSIFVPTMFIGLVLGLHLSIKYFSKMPGAKILTMLFLIILIMQFIDTLTFFGLIRMNHEVYYVRLHPPFASLAFGYVIWLIWIENERKEEATLRAGQIAKGVAHDLRSPVAVLKVLSNVSKNLEKDERELLSGAISSIHGITDNLLKICRPNTTENANLSTKAATTAEVLERVSMNKIILEIVTRRNYVLKSKGQVEILHEGIGDSIPEFFCSLNSIEFNRALDNILGNAIEAASANLSRSPLIKVQLQREGNRAVVEVIDNGERVDDFIVKRLNRKEFSHTTKATGHGIGLSEVWRIVQAHQGALTFEKAATGGMIVRMDFPMV